METCPGKGVIKDKFPNTRKPSHQQVCGEFGNLRGQHNWRKGKKKNTTGKTPNHNFQQSLGFATIEQMLDREVWVACLG